MSNTANTERGSCQICLVIDAGAAARERLAAIIAGSEIASVVIRSQKAASTDAADLKVLIETCQSAGVAAFLQDDTALARTLRADGVHLAWSRDLKARFDEAREILGTRAMIGVDIACDAPQVRHDAMEIAEAGADYIAFPAGANQAELLDWWSQIFEVPCVALDVASVEVACNLAAQGAEFIAVTVPAGASPADCAALVKSIARAVADSIAGTAI